MSPKTKFVCVATIPTGFIGLVMGLFAYYFWTPLPDADKATLFRIFGEHFPYFFSFLFFLITLFVLVIDWFFRLYIIPLNRLADEVALKSSVNPLHRVKVDGGRDLVRLCRMINENALYYEELKKNVEQKIRFAKAEVEAEKDILASLMAELPEGVMVCNTQGTILLFNIQARRFFTGLSGSSENSENRETFIGLGRSVYNHVDRHLIEHAREEIDYKLAFSKSNPASHFVVIGGGHQLLRAEAVPVLDHQRNFNGLILIFRDITRQIEKDRSFNRHLRSLTNSVRASVSGIRSAAELLIEYARIDSDDSESFLKIIHKESLMLSRLLDREWFDSTGYIKKQWPLIPMNPKDLMGTVMARSSEIGGISLAIDEIDAQYRIRIDNYSLTVSLLFLLDLLKTETGSSFFSCSLICRKGFFNLDILWSGASVKLEKLRQWQQELIRFKEEKIPLTLGEVIEHHEAEIVSFSKRGAEDLACIRLILPVAEADRQEHIRRIAILPGGRPEFYDFDMFHQPGQTPELERAELTELTFTVFDTETTGLDPQTDEIISIGAIRIVNGRLLRTETFNQLIDPRRILPIESTEIHGIHPEDLEGMPLIENVLPKFYSFCENTVLVAHNAAFDMRMLEMKQKLTGIVFDQPVLDTLLLSAAAHSAHARGMHSLEAIAERLGIDVTGRHTALGDALVTGQIFLKLIRVLAFKGIHTFKQALDASRKTYYARLRY